MRYIEDYFANRLKKKEKEGDKPKPVFSEKEKEEFRKIDKQNGIKSPEQILPKDLEK